MPIILHIFVQDFNQKAQLNEQIFYHNINICHIIMLITDSCCRRRICPGTDTQPVGNL